MSSMSVCYVNMATRQVVTGPRLVFAQYTDRYAQNQCKHLVVPILQHIVYVFPRLAKYTMKYELLCVLIDTQCGHTSDRSQTNHTANRDWYPASA